MLVLSRRVGERLMIGDDIVVTVIEVRSDGVRLGIEAPREVRVHRAEVLEAVRRANVEAVGADDGTADVLRSLVLPLGVPADAAPAADPGPDPRPGDSTPGTDPASSAREAVPGAGPEA